MYLVNQLELLGKLTQLSELLPNSITPILPDLFKRLQICIGAQPETKPVVLFSHSKHSPVHQTVVLISEVVSNQSSQHSEPYIFKKIGIWVSIKRNGVNPLASIPVLGVFPLRSDV